MAENESSRKKFLQMLGLSTGAAVLGTTVIAEVTGNDHVALVKSEHKEFMARYEQWMNEYLKVIEIQKTHPGDPENHKTLMALAAKAETFKPELAEYMHDENFALVFRASIEKMTKQIPT